MNKKFVELAPKYYLQGYSCSESIIAAAVEMGIADKELISAVTSFSGGLSAGCICGAIAGSQLVIGLLHGRDKDNTARKLAKDFYNKFIKIHKASCCRVLTRDFVDFHSPERKKHCTNMVYDCAKLLDEALESAEVKN